MATPDEQCASILARITALEKILDEREERTKDRFLAMEKGVTLALTSAEKAVDKAEAATQKRFENVNEFRDTLRDQANTFMPRAEYQAQHVALSSLVTTNSQRIAELMPRSEYQIQHAAMVENINLLNNRYNTVESTTRGKQEGLSIIGQIGLGIIAGIGAIGGILVTLFRHGS